MNLIINGVDCIADCGGAGVLRIIKFVFILLDMVFFLIPMGLILMMSVDIAKNVISGKDDEAKKNLNMAIKRLIFCVALFLVPTIVDFAIGLVSDIGVKKLACVEIAKNEDLSQCEIDMTIDKDDYDVDTPNFNNPNGYTVVSGNDEENKSSTSEKEYAIIINPSHQINNYPITSNDKYNTEKKSMFALGTYLNIKFKTKGYEVVMTKNSGYIDKGDGCWDSSDGSSSDPNSAWYKCADKQIKWGIEQVGDKKSIYIALHSNAGGLMGPQVYSATGKTNGKKIADKVCSSLTSVYTSNGYTPNNGNCSLSNDTFVTEPIRFYNQGGKGDAILIEIGYHDNADNQKFIEEHLSDLADAIVKGVENYVNS